MKSILKYTYLTKKEGFNLRYHINLEGKVYPCRAKILKCPYSEANHSENKVDLYYAIMGKDMDVEPSEKGLEELKKNNRLKSLYTLSEEIATSNSPVEVVTQTLKKAIERVADFDLQKYTEQWNNYVDKESEHVYDLLNFGYPIPSHVPKEIVDEGYYKFKIRNDSYPQEYALSTGNSLAKFKSENMEKKNYIAYENYKKNHLNKDNYKGTQAWLIRDFEKYTHDLNTSKMITQPIFYGDIEQARKTIKSLDDYELLGAFDDYSITDKEIEENVKEANHFKYEYRDDLTNEANENLKEWYDRNREIYRNWKINTSKRVLLSMEIAEELDRREILRADQATAKMLRESEA